MENQKQTVLVAVSDIFFYTKIRDALRSGDYVLERARAQEEVSEKAKVHTPAALILNMNDEKVDAFKALEEIKRDDYVKHIPILAFANHEEVDTWRRAKELGVGKIVSRNEFSSRTKDLIDETIALGNHPYPALAPRGEGEKS
ncbi:MAG TPA: histidine kinase [Nitrospiraceae bacterium]|nr:histidine kinase [Nitrospiraceae bacterium]